MRSLASLLLSIAGIGTAFGLPAAASGAGTWTLENPTSRAYRDEPVRLGIDPPEGEDFRILAEGEEVPFQIGEEDGRRRIWVLASVEPAESIEYRLEAGRGSGAPELPPEDRVVVRRTEKRIELDNGRFALRLPAQVEDDVPCPVERLRVGGRWAGRGFWRTERALMSFSAEVLADGPLFAKVRLRYAFEGRAGLYGTTPAFATVEVTLFAGQSHAVIEEAHEMGRGDFWELDGASGWKPRHAFCKPHSNGFGRPDLGPWPPETLEVGQTRMGKKLLNLMPRWTQAYDEGWFFACHDTRHAAGALVCRASRWHWPHENMIEARVKESADYAGLRCPTWKGRRYWFLVAGPVDLWEGDGAKDYVRRHAFEALDKLVREYTLEWPGRMRGEQKGGSKGWFRGRDFYSSAMNPSGAMRGYGRNAWRNVGKPGDLRDLADVQVLLDGDAYGSYWNYWSPENPNFFTDFIRGPIAKIVGLEGHPRFGELAALAEEKLRTDLYHSITLPGGAGQECPGYVAYAMKTWEEMAPVLKKRLGFDLTAWPRYRAGASFLFRVSQPIGGGKRRCHPGGDTHPPGPDVLGIAERFGVTKNAAEDIRDLTTEELPGFGAVFRNRPGTERETYLAFKSGPNRGHYHGDQLSFHYCADARPLAIDHMCSYSPRAGQEHMHNRVAFHTEELPWANMDGYERLIAFATSDEVDVAVGQVESERLRVTTEYPPEGWDVYLPEHRFETPLVYRRTIVLVKGGARDYFVLRDQYRSAEPDLQATWCLHVLSDRCERRGDGFDFGRLQVVCVRPETLEVGRHDWDFEKRKRDGSLVIRENTKGLRLSTRGASGEFITVLYPGSEAPEVESTAGGVRVGRDEVLFAGGIDEREGTAYVTVRREGETLLVLDGEDIDLERSQGEIGLFVPDAGYPFGTIPDWLIRERSRVPDRAPAWARPARKYETPEP